jgi:hypothetical protein
MTSPFVHQQTAGCVVTRVGVQPRVHNVRRSHLVPLLVVWVIPVVVAAVLLVLADLTVLAVALVVIELVVGATVVAARRQPVARSSPTSRPWLVPLLMIGALLVMAGIAVVASRTG